MLVKCGVYHKASSRNFQIYPVYRDSLCMIEKGVFIPKKAEKRHAFSFSPRLPAQGVRYRHWNRQRQPRRINVVRNTWVDCEQSLFFFRFSGSNARARERRSRETRETRAAAREEKRETARLARANELSVGLTTQNTIGWFVKRWQQTVNNRNHWQVDDGWSTAGKFVTFPEKKNIRYGAKRSIRRSHLSGYVTWSRNLNAQSLSSLSRNALVPKR